MNNQVYEVDLIDLCRAVFKRWKLLVLCTVLFGAVGAGLSMVNRSETRYSASALISVGVQSRFSSVTNVTGDSQTVGADIQVQKDTVVGTLSDWASQFSKLGTVCQTVLTSDQVLRNVADRCDADISLVKGAVSVDYVKDTNLVSITAETAQPELAQDICNELASEAQDALRPAIGDGSIEVISAAQKPTESIAQGGNKKIVLLAFIGFVLAAAYVVLDYLLVPRVRTEMDVQKHLGMMLLGTVPTGKEKKGNG